VEVVRGLRARNLQSLRTVTWPTNEQLFDVHETAVRGIRAFEGRVLSVDRSMDKGRMLLWVIRPGLGVRILGRARSHEVDDGDRPRHHAFPAGEGRGGRRSSRALRSSDASRWKRNPRWIAMGPSRPGTGGRRRIRGGISPCRFTAAPSSTDRDGRASSPATLDRIVEGIRSPDRPGGGITDGQGA
jgi:hypothetical protein